MIPALILYLTVGVMTVVHSRLVPKKAIDVLVLGFCALIGPPLLVASLFVRAGRFLLDFDA